MKTKCAEITIQQIHDQLRWMKRNKKKICVRASFHFAHPKNPINLIESSSEINVACGVVDDVPLHVIVFPVRHTQRLNDATKCHIHRNGFNENLILFSHRIILLVLQNFPFFLLAPFVCVWQW